MIDLIVEISLFVAWVVALIHNCFLLVRIKRLEHLINLLRHKNEIEKILGGNCDN